jgi:hypothetical protein
MKETNMIHKELFTTFDIGINLSIPEDEIPAIIALFNEEYPELETDDIEEVYEHLKVFSLEESSFLKKLKDTFAYVIDVDVEIDNYEKNELSEEGF